MEVKRVETNTYRFPESITVADFAKRMCANWKFPETWMAWPPDLFAFTSSILDYTGVYRVLITRVWEGHPSWQKDVEQAAQKWIRGVDETLRARSQKFTEGESPLASEIPLHKLLEINKEDWESAREKVREEIDNPEESEGEVENPIAHSFHVVKELCEKVTLAHLRTFPGRYEEKEGRLINQQTRQHFGRDVKSLTNCNEAKMARALLRLHAIADEASGNFGLLSAIHEDTAVARFMGNLLLTARGSVSTVPKHWVTVLPKMRTPQRGFTLRSFSHHLTCHTTEVETMWRVAPMLNTPRNTLNILSVPWPENVDPGFFHAEDDTFQHWRSFRYDPPQEPELPVDSIIRLTSHLDEEGLSPHLVVLPEASISRSEFVKLLNALQEKYVRTWKEARESDWENSRRSSVNRSHVPIVIAGVRHDPSKNNERQPSADEEPVEGDEEILHLNEVRLAIYFSGRWYVLGQRKHHRWQLDRSQIQQYQLEGKLSTDRSLFENIQLGQRRLSVLAPTGWLSLCPLICEDLAQLEPVSELIRGGGPTLLISLLMDGPQLAERWAARYASVFADDPGTAVLNQTSLGMCLQSKRIQDGRVRKEEESKRTVTSWKDPSMGFQELSLDDETAVLETFSATTNGFDTSDEEEVDEAKAMLITIRSRWTEEFTADGRSDHGNAATLEFEGVRLYPYPPDPNTGASKHDTSQNENSDASSTHQKSTASTPAHEDMEASKPRNEDSPEDTPDLEEEFTSLTDSPRIGLWHDLREHTVALYVIDTMIALKDKVDMSENLVWWISKDSGKRGEEIVEEVQASDPQGIREISKESGGDSGPTASQKDPTTIGSRYEGFFNSSLRACMILITLA